MIFCDEKYSFSLVATVNRNMFEFSYCKTYVLEISSQSHDMTPNQINKKCIRIQNATMT